MIDVVWSVNLVGNTIYIVMLLRT